MTKKIKFQLPLKNKGSVDLTNVVTTITPPVSGVSFILANPTVGTYDELTSEWTVANLPVDAEYFLYAEWQVTDENDAPFTFTVTTTSDQNANEDTPADNTASKTYTLADLYPCPNCPPPSMELTDTTWSPVHGKIDFEECDQCTTELTLVPSSEVNINTVTIDSETGYYTVELTDRTEDWSFQVEGNCINCPYWCNTGNDYGPFGPITVSGSGSCCDPDDLRLSEDFADLQSGNTVTLPSNASSITAVYRNGRRMLKTLYTFNSPNEIEFTENFSIGEGAYGEDVTVDFIAG